VCGVHNKEIDCDNQQTVKNIEKVFKSSQKYLFPTQLVLQNETERAFALPKVSGGWSDKRDYELCMKQVVFDNIKQIY
jgi:hypothetical protein